jgi:glyoxylase-like metal-dependent hydrolase (beta-lactamase superfamily II)
MKYACKLLFGFSIVAGLSGSAILIHAQQGVAPSLRPITGGVYWMEGGAAVNIGAVVGKDGVIVIDAKTNAAAGKQILMEIGKVTPLPVTTVILTDSDFDHTYGLAGFPHGLTIIAQENAKKDLEATAGTARPAPQLPTKAVDKKEPLTINGVRMVLLHYQPAHTSGDLMVYLPDQKIVFTGDIISTTCCGNSRSEQPLTMIKSNEGGSAEGWIETVRKLIALNADTYVPGHGPLQTKADVQKRLTRVEERRAQVKKMVAEGKSLGEIKQALHETNPPGYDVAQFPDFTTVIYTELAQKH